MTSQNGFRNHILNLIQKQRTKKASIQASIQKDIQELDNKIAALETTLKIFDEFENVSSSEPKYPITPAQLRANANTQPKALEYLATHMNGEIHYGEAADIIKAAGMAKGKRKNLASHLYGIMNESEDWDKLGQGRFRYKKYRPTLFPQEVVAK